MKSVLVVGAGFAGLSAAIELARAGARVEVLEARDEAGGRADRFTTPLGFVFDGGPTLIVMVDVLRATLGDEAFAALRLQRLEPGYRVHWPDGTHFDMSSNLARFLDEIARFEGFEHRSPALRYLADVHEQYVQARAKILEVDHTPLSFVRALAAPGKFAPWSLGKLLPFARRYFRDERAVQALTFQSLYLGSSPLRAPAMYALLAVEEVVGGVWYASGGTGAIVGALVAECERLGVRFRYRTAVQRVLSNGGRVNGVACAQGTLHADGVVVTADREPAMQRLFGEPVRRPVRRIRYGHSAMLWYLSVRGPVHLPHHAVMLPADPSLQYARLDDGRLPEEPFIYACNASATDPSVAPEGDSSLMLLVPVPNAQQLPRFDESALFDRVLERVELSAGPLRERIVESRSRGPREFARDLQLAHGAAFGPDHALDQMGPMRPAIRHPSLRNAVFAGSGTHPGSGIPMVLISGRLAAQRLHEMLA